jgi:hypothetical protein
VDSASAERDWLAGDTVVAQFESRDSAGSSRAALTSIRAAGAARSLTVEAQESRPRQPTINYARGDAIVVTMKQDGTEDVEEVRIRGSVDGAQIDPGTADTTAAPATPRRPRGTAEPAAPPQP